MKKIEAVIYLEAPELTKPTKQKQKGKKENLKARRGRGECAKKTASATISIRKEKRGKKRNAKT